MPEGKLRGVAAVCAGALLAMGLAVAAANAQQGPDRVTGGGQVLLNSNGDGALDTVGFQAVDRPGRGPQGQMEYVPTGSGVVSEERWHGRVTCLEVDGNSAVFAGQKTNGDTSTPYFQVTVVDNGPGRDGGEQGNDVFVLEESGDPFNCERRNGDEYTLARGNATVHDSSNGNNNG